MTLSEYLGGAAAAEILRCGRERGWTARVPARPWRVRGHTEAVLALVNIADPGGVRKVVVKIAPALSGPEAYERLSDPYTAAARDCPAGFRPHLVGEAERPWSTAQGGLLTFQRLAGDDVRSVRSLDQLPYPRLVEVSRRIVRALLLDWNGTGLQHNAGVFDGRPPTYADFIRQTVGGPLSTRGSIYRYADVHGLLPERVGSIRFPDGTVYPNPLYLASAQSPLHQPRLDVLTGRSHGDLHLLNVLVPDVTGVRPALEQFQFVDLDTYQPHRSLASDPVFLLLSGIAHWLPRVPAGRWDAVREAVLHPTGTTSGEPPFDLVRAVFSGTTGAIRDLGKGLSGDWTTQFLLSTLATALSFTTFVDLGPRRRAWFFRLAAECGRVVLGALGQPVPDDAVPVGDLFGAHPPGTPAEPVTPAEPMMPAGSANPESPEASVDRTLTRIWTRPTGSADLDGLFRRAYRDVRGCPDPMVVVAAVRHLHEDACRLLGPGAATTLFLLHNLGYWSYRAGDPDRAGRLFEEAWQGRRQALGPDHPDTEESYRCARDGRLRGGRPPAEDG